MVYTYSVANDFAFSGINPALLSVQIRASIVTSLLSVSITGDVVSVNFQNALSAGDLMTLNLLVREHRGDAVIAVALSPLIFAQRLTVNGSLLLHSIDRVFGII